MLGSSQLGLRSEDLKLAKEPRQAAGLASTFAAAGSARTYSLFLLRLLPPRPANVASNWRSPVPQFLLLS